MSIERFQKILWSLPDPLMVLSSTHQVNYVNSALEKMLGVHGSK